MRHNLQKKIRSFLSLGICVAIGIILSCCANEKAPEGGKKDTTPPKAKKINPPNKSLHFTAKKIEITFNKYIKAGGFSQTLISPPLDKRPDFKIVNKTLIIKLKSPLRENTTYTINFADDIKDVNEGNILNNFTYVFSTGDFLDSQKVSGTVYIAKDNSAADGVIVSLYPKDSANAILRAKPFYFAKTDKSGHFQISNIKADYYQIFALKDQNYNYIFDQPNEMIAFSDTPINLTDTTSIIKIDTIAKTGKKDTLRISSSKKIELYLFEDAGRTRFMGTKAMAPGNIQIYYSNAVKDFNLTMNPAPERFLWYPNATKDTINYWYSDYYDKKAILYLSANDTTMDTSKITLNFINIDSFARNPKYRLSLTNPVVNQPDTSKKSQATQTSIKENITVQELYKPVKLLFTRPIVDINEAKTFKLFEDTAKKEITTRFSIDDSSKLSVSFDFAKNENTNYTLEIPDSAFKDIFGSWNRKIIYKFRTTSKDAYGNIQLLLKSKHPDKSYVVNLLDASGAVVKQFPFSGEAEKSIHLENMPAGDYKISAVDDDNNNGKRDTGNFKLRHQPEKVINFKDTHSLKGLWDLDIEVNL